MNIRDSEDSDELIINLTPMIDVVFLLLIFFMVTTTFLDPERQIDIELPIAESGAEATDVPEEIVLTILEDGSVRSNGETLDQEALLFLLKRAAQNNPDTPVTIRGHRLARHERIVSVMDACGIAGLSNLAVGTTADKG